MILPLIQLIHPTWEL